MSAAERLLHQEVLPGGEHLQSHRHVQRVRQGDDHGVDLGIVEDVPVVVRPEGHAEALGQDAQAMRRAAGEALHARIRQTAELGQVELVGDAPGADDAEREGDRGGRSYASLPRRQSSSRSRVTGCPERTALNTVASPSTRPTTFTADAGRISPALREAGVWPKKMQKALPGGQ